MKLWSRFILGGLVLALTLAVGINPAAAAPKKKKEEKKAERHREHFEKHVIDGLNISGKPGYFFADTAGTLRQSQIAGAVHLQFDTWGNVFEVPVGGSYGITDKILVNVNTAFYAAGGTSGLYFLDFGGKYGFGNVLKDSDSNLKIAAGLDFAIGPLTSVDGYSSTAFAFDPYGVCTWTLPDGWQFNGKLGLYVQNYSETVSYTNYLVFPPQTVSQSHSYSYSYFQLDLGAAYPFDKDLTGIAELATNGVVGYGGVGGTPLVVGIRTGHDVQLQALAGLDLGGAVGLFLGGGIALFSE
jgi:hypothetical protein